MVEKACLSTSRVLPLVVLGVFSPGGGASVSMVKLAQSELDLTTLNLAMALLECYLRCTSSF